MSARFAEGSVRLGVEAVETCLARAGLGTADVDFLVTTTCTGRLVPSLDAHLIGALGLRSDVQRVHVGDTGCASAMVALQQGWNYLRAFPERRALVVSVELCSTTYYLDDEAERRWRMRSSRMARPRCSSARAATGRKSSVTGR
jgi:alkylresorcinol/alkylpyrone synthase